MSLFNNRATGLAATLQILGYQPRGGGRQGVSVTSDTALRHSAVWACLRLRADLVSTTPIDVYRRVAGVQVELAKPPLLVSPDGSIDIVEWLYSSQIDLDRYGNAFGVITGRDAKGNTQEVTLANAQECSVFVKDGRLSHYRISGNEYDPRDVWHERQFTVSGLHVGLSPVAYAAYSLGTYLSAQEFALDWFDSGAAPTGHLRNTLAPTVEPDVADAVKARFKNAVQGRDVFVTGRDWEYTMQQVPASTVMFMDAMKYGVGDACRFFGVPGDLIDAETGGSSVTYANVTQRNLQLLTMNLGPVYVRRERAFSRALPGYQYAKFATDALLRMDPETRIKSLLSRVQGRTLTPDEARELDNLPPFTEEQYQQFDRLFTVRRETAQATPAQIMGGTK